MHVQQGTRPSTKFAQLRRDARRCDQRYGATRSVHHSLTSPRSLLTALSPVHSVTVDMDKDADRSFHAFHHCARLFAPTPSLILMLRERITSLTNATTFYATLVSAYVLIRRMVIRIDHYGVTIWTERSAWIRIYILCRLFIYLLTSAVNRNINIYKQEDGSGTLTQREPITLVTCYKTSIYKTSQLII